MSNKHGIYLAIFRSKCSVGESRAELDYLENFTSIKASSPEEAEQKAVENADFVNTSYANQYRETVIWALKQIVTVDVMLEDEIDLRSDTVDFFVRGFDDYEAYQRLYKVKDEG